MKDNLHTLWSRRLNQELKQLVRYSRYIFNDHFSIVLVVLLGFGALSYQYLLTSLTDTNLLISLMVGFLLVGVLFIGQPIWLTSIPDRSYLLPQGDHWRKYWQKGTYLSAAIGLVIVLLMSSLFYPLISLTSSWQWDQLIIFVLGWLIYRICRSLRQYLAIYTVDRRDRTFIGLDLVIVSVSYSLSLLMSSAIARTFVWLTPAIALFIYLLWRWHQSQSQLFDFNYVLTQEVKRLATQRKWLAIFVDLPQIAPEIKRYKYLDPLLEWISRTFTLDADGYLTLRRLVRNTHLSSIWWRVTVFFAIVLLGVDLVYLQLVIGCLANYLVLVQWGSILANTPMTPMALIYPTRLPAVQRLKQIQQLVRVPLFIQLIILAIVLLMSHWSWQSVGIILVWFVVLAILLGLYLPWFWKKATVNQSR